MIIYAILCILDGISFVLPAFVYIAAMLLYVLPMSYIKSKEAELIEVEFEKVEGLEKKVKEIMTDKAKRVFILEQGNVKKFLKGNYKQEN